MVAKITFGNSLFGALSYNGEKVEEGEGKVLGANKIYYNKDGSFDISACMEDFLMYMPSHITTKKPIVHISLNPHPDDKLSDEQLTAIATEYIERMGYGNQPYMIYKHEDIDRHHVHIVTLGVDEQGKKIDDGNNFFRSKKITRELEQRYGLLPAEKQKQKEAYRFRKVNPAEGNIKKQIGSVIKPLMKTYRFLSLNEYRALLSLYNIKVEEVKGEVKGRTYHGLIYSVTDDKGNTVGNPFKSSVFGKSVGAEAMLKRIEQSQAEIKEKRLGGHTKRTIFTTMNTCRSLPELEKELSLKGIDAVFRRNDAGRIYGATFIDHHNGCVLNGSRMGKELSANAIEQWANNPHPVLSDASAPTVREPHHAPQSPDTPSLFSEDSASAVGLLDLPIVPDGVDPEEEKFRRRMQRKKRKSRKL